MSAPERTSVRLDAALELARVGYYLAPVTLKRGPDGKKRPRYYGSWDKMSTRDPAQIKDWFVQYDCSFLVDTGKSGVVAVDLDLADNRDGIAAWEALNGPCGGIVVDTPSGGQHHYFAADPGRPLINSADPATGIDTRAEGGHVYAPGAVILGADDQSEPGGYRARGPLYAPGDLPPVPELLHARRKQRSPRSELAREDRRFTNAEAKVYIQTKLDELANAAAGGRNVALNTAAFRIGHFVSDEFGTTYEAAVAAVIAHLPPGYGDAPGEAREVDATIRSGLTDGIEDGTYVRRRVEPESPLDVESAEALRARKVAERVEWLRIEQEARAEVAATQMAPLHILAFGEFLGSPQPEYLVPGFLYRASTAKVFGPPGGTKSYFLLDLALSLATGRTWHGRDLPQTRVHYVMAEGHAVNALRTAGWLAHHGIEHERLEGWFTAIPQGVLLTPEGVGQYLPFAAADRPGLIVLDTKNRMMVGEENSASDVAVMIRAMDAIREPTGACVCLVDHTGISDQTRGRGSNAVTAAMDSEIRVSRDDKTGIATALITRDKASEPGVRVSYALVNVAGVPTSTGVRAPAVCEPQRASELPFDKIASEAYQSWADPTLWELPSDVIKLAAAGSGKAAILDLARYMRAEASDAGAVGRTRAEAIKALLTLPTYGNDSVIRNAWDRLVSDKSGRIRNINTDSKTAASHWMPKPTDPKRGT